MPLTLDQLHDIGEKSVVTTLEKNQSIRSLLYVYDSGAKNIIAFDFKGPDEDAFKKQILFAVQSLRLRGMFGGAQMVAEAWITMRQADTPASEYVRPVNDPRRKEAVIIGSWDSIGNKRLTIYDLDRTGERPALGQKLDVLDGAKMASWLDSAFVDAESILRK